MYLKVTQLALAAISRRLPSDAQSEVREALFHTPFTRAGFFAQRGPRSAPPWSARKDVVQRGQSNCHASSRRHSSQAVRPEKAGAAPGKDGSPMLGQKSTKLSRFGYSRYSAVGPMTALGRAPMMDSNRRTILTTGAAVAATAAVPQVFAQQGGQRGGATSCRR